MGQEGGPPADTDTGAGNEIRTFLIADVRGYTLFTQERGDEAAAKLAERFARIAREGVEGRGGQVIELRGDEALCVFTSARQAIRAAVELQDRFVDETIADPDLPLGVGIGLDAGEAVPMEGGYRGGALNLAARLCGQAGPGEVLASREVVHLARKVDGVRYDDRGLVSMKGLAEPVRVMRVVSEAGDPALLLAPVLPKAAPPPRRTPRWRSRRAAIAAGVVVVLLAAGLPLALHHGGTKHLAALGANSVGEIDPTTNAIVDSVSVGSGPSGIAYGEGSIWVTNSFEDTVSRLDPGSARVVQTIAVGHGPVGIAAGAGAVWVANADDRTVSWINSTTNSVVKTIPVGNGPTAIAAGKDGVWVTNSLDDTVSRIDPKNGGVLGTFPVGRHPSAIALGIGSVWVVDSGDNAVSRLDPATGNVVRTISVGNGPADVAVGGGAAWVTNGLDGTVSRIDPSTGDVTATLPVGDGPRGIAVTTDAVWVANQFGYSLSLVDAGTGSLTATVRLGSAPQDVVATGDRLWVTARAPSGLHRGGTLRGFTVNADSMDPAMAYATWSWSILAMTNDGLVGFERVGGPDGATLVSDLATSLPAPTDGGKTYTFQLRPGIHYSTGQPVRPEDIRYAIERVLQLGSPGAPFYSGIAGAATCGKDPKTPCDLSSGVVVDDAAGTITFRLTAPDPEFLYKLALPFADAIPSTVPRRNQMNGPVPATGPYMVKQYVPSRVTKTGTELPGGSLVLVRNPHFQEWSASAQPDGFPDRIAMTIGTPLADQFTAVEQGKADFVSGYLTGAPPKDQLEEIRTRFTAQFHRYTGPNTEYVAFNARRPPFDNELARRAVNFAIDRAHVVDLAGGPDLANVTCQVLPPSFPAYRPYCPYTVHPNAAGTWSGPDLDKARALVKASGTAGAKVTVAGGPSFFGSTPQYMVGLLNRLGYRASLESIQDPFQYFGVIQDSATMPEVAVAGWIADYPAASDFLNQLLSCRSFVPNSHGNNNIAEFCDRSVDAQIYQALQLQVTDPAAASAVWENIDRTVTDLAPWAPLYNEVGGDFVSKRVGNYQHNPEFGILLDQHWVG